MASTSIGLLVDPGTCQLENIERNIMKRIFRLLALPLVLLGFSAHAATIEVQADKPAHKVPSTLWGVFFEDINHAADGGLNPELVRNRSFEDADTLVKARDKSANQNETAASTAKSATTEEGQTPITIVNPSFEVDGEQTDFSPTGCLLPGGRTTLPSLNTDHGGRL